jgi:hypothetical protein
MQEVGESSRKVHRSESSLESRLAVVFLGHGIFSVGKKAKSGAAIIGEWDKVGWSRTRNNLNGLVVAYVCSHISSIKSLPALFTEVAYFVDRKGIRH